MVMQREPMPGTIPDVPCQCFDPETLTEIGCQCGLEEKAFRAGAPLDAEQREWCLNEIASHEGYTRADYEDCNDRDLGRAVLGAWRDYCRDKGLL